MGCTVFKRVLDEVFARAPLALLLAWGTAWAACPARAVAATSADAPFESTAMVSAASAPPGGKVTLRYTVHVHPAHYIYRDATSVTVVDAGGLQVGAPVFPKPLTHFDKYENADKEVYEQTITVAVPARVPASARPGTALQVVAEVRYRGCNASMCFFPKTDTHKLSIVVGAASGRAPAAESRRGDTPPPVPAGAAGPADPAGDVQDGAVGVDDASLEPERGVPPTGGASGAVGSTEAPPAAPQGTAIAALVPALPPALVPATDVPAPAVEASLEQRLKSWAERLSHENFALFLVIVFLGGLASSLTPCVYPMIPITVGVIGASSGSSRLRAFVLSCVYVLGLAATYSALGVVAAVSGGMVGSAFQNPIVIVAVAGFFFLLALGMLGVYNFALPSGLVNRISDLAQGPDGGGRGGYVGAFLVGLVGGVVCSPCVGPVAGLVLGYMAQGEFTVLQGLAAMAVFSLGLGVLFLVVGTFSGAIAAMPRSGAWMERVKYVFSFVMMGAAIYYVGTLLPAAVTAGLYTVLLVVAGVTLGALEPLPDDVTWAPRLGKAFAILLLLCGGLLAAQATLGARIAALDARMASLERRPTTGGPATTTAIAWGASEPEAVARARAQGKPLMIDFTADWCVACKELEHKTFTDRRVIDSSERFVALTVDCTRNDDPVVREVQRRYGVVSLPTILFVDAAGKARHDLTVKGFMEADEFLGRMHSAIGATAALSTPGATGG